ncbi:DNA (cytosine-5)-methyltransferase 1 [Pseudomonas citronellolis]|uniref:DNA (cytosine-5-)-methyltransferase n=1 Tax=Pseudomonas citronellolis TaxID=53408 RepID=A0AAQ1KKI4_9PSED|nr:DNA (cytosine-5)-methyltransferase 1 [Pseudomonas citronellolis]
MPPPTIDVWENVPGVLSSRDNAFGRFLGSLSGAGCELQPPGKRWPKSGCVYGPKRAIAWRVLDAQYFGVAQRRRRLFVVASARTGFHPAQVLFEREGVRRDHPPRRGEGQGVTSALDASFGRLRGCSGQDLNHGHSHLVAFGGNNQSGPIDVATARNASASASGRLDFESETFVVHGTQDPIVARGCAHALGRNSGQENAVFDPNQITSAANRSQPALGLCHTLTASRQPPCTFASDVAPTLRSGNFRSHSNPLTQADSLVVTSAVRRLTPRECERLQGFPDDYTLIPWRGKPAEECPDGPRYKAIGNSKAVPVVRWIARRIEWALQHPWENDL